ncbi:MAG TPA: FAD-dependent oxidoreductase [Kofleriaceae bacterium]|jgi:predicted NAD/FAD-binding protein|nr:FAD-dependent oxidoreductase [Kofleriaceae bacterium]
MRVAIIGSGIAGLAAADALGDFDLTLYEASPRAGGHVYTVALPGHPAVDMGFIVHNRARYPHFCALLDELGIATRPTQMAFSVSAGGRQWGSASLSALFADRRSIASPRHWRFLLEALAFLRRARADLRHRNIGDVSLGDYCADWSRELYDRFVVPLAAALWSLAPDRCGAFPAITYLSFLDHHGMLSPIRPLAWRTIVGGSQRYVDALLAKLHARPRFALELATPVRSIARDATAVIVDGTRYDRIVIATHADTALALLADPSPDERAALRAFHYSTNRTVLHTDRAFLPSKPAAHAAWNYVADPDTSRVAVTYSMTHLQGLPDVPYLVTLNPRREPRGILHETSFEHPQLDRAALAAQQALTALQGTRRTYFAGAHFGFGFHEDGMRSGLAAAAKLRADAHREQARRSA